VGTYHNSFAKKYIKVDQYKINLIYLDPHQVRSKANNLETEVLKNP
jgi:hypothetical protein